MLDRDAEDLLALVDRLKRYDIESSEWNFPFAIDIKDGNRAAVLVALSNSRNGAYEVLMTLRSSHLRRSGGEVSLPGGKIDDQDGSEIEAALREAEEEVGLRKEDVRVVAQLPPLITLDGILVTPVIALLREGFIPTPNASEVEIVFYLPLARFLSQEGHRSVDVPGAMYWHHFFDDDIGGHMFTTWGITALIMVLVASVAYGRKPTFPIDIVQCAFLAHLRTYLLMYVASLFSRL